ncbi:hypothetical protein P280DRAFT_23553 [Massarina eburnea CBS 473.64]|uniref:Uncharacterized protein n=1 Tax=Massarina eburnea CBS 473.64 TaxID=1395130 RepID=A0A6A6RXW5_9PLEO|nr:hypothetical protein P280DRAFT_23553 [Massarina eburnea CBS 473.64]
MTLEPNSHPHTLIIFNGKRATKCRALTNRLQESGEGTGNGEEREAGLASRTGEFGGRRWGGSGGTGRGSSRGRGVERDGSVAGGVDGGHGLGGRDNRSVAGGNGAAGDSAAGNNRDVGRGGDRLGDGARAVRDGDGSRLADGDGAGRANGDGGGTLQFVLVDMFPKRKVSSRVTYIADGGVVLVVHGLVDGGAVVGGNSVGTDGGHEGSEDGEGLHFDCWGWYIKYVGIKTWSSWKRVEMV